VPFLHGSLLLLLEKTETMVFWFILVHQKSPEKTETRLFRPVSLFAPYDPSDQLRVIVQRFPNTQIRNIPIGLVAKTSKNPSPQPTALPLSFEYLASSPK